MSRRFTDDLLGRIPPKGNHSGTFEDAPWIIEVEESDGSSCAGGQRLDACAIEAEVTIPTLPPGVEEHNDTTGRRIDGGEIGPFVAIAHLACPGPVIQNCRTAMLRRDDMIRFVRQKTSSSWMRQYSHLPAARSRTCCRSAAETCILLAGCLWSRLPKSAASCRLDHAHQMLDMHISLKLIQFVVSDAAGPLFLDQGVKTLDKSR